MKTMLKYLQPFFKRMSVGLTIKIVGTVVELFLPYILSHILKLVEISDSIRQVVYWGGLMVLCAAVALIMNVTANRMASRVASDFSENVRKDLFGKMLRLSAAQTDRFTIQAITNTFKPIER